MLGNIKVLFLTGAPKSKLLDTYLEPKRYQRKSLDSSKSESDSCLVPQ